MNWERISETNLPDSGTLVLAAHEDEPYFAQLVYLELSDDSEGHGEPHWEDADDSTCTYPIDDFTHWCLYVGPRGTPVETTKDPAATPHPPTSGQS